MISLCAKLENWKENMELLEHVIFIENLNNAYKQVYKNKGLSGVDGVTVDELNQDKLIGIIRWTIKDGNLVSLIRKLLQSGVMENGVIKETKKEIPRGWLFRYD